MKKTKLLLATTLVLILSACNTKTNNEETNSSAASSHATETTEDSSASSGVSTTGTSAVANHGGTTTPNAGSSSHVQSTAEDNANTGSSNHTNVNDNNGTSTGTSTSTNTNSNNANNDSVGSGSEDTTDSTGTSNDNNTTDNSGNATGNDQNHTGGTDSNGTEAIDTTPPVITLNGEANITLEQNAVYNELGATALDDVDGNVSVITTGNVDTSTVGSCTVTYSAQDSAGNEANTTRTITVIDVTPPVITLNGQADVSLSVGESYVELGATAVDAVDGNVTVTTTGTVDTNTAGAYAITYTAIDSVGNEANVTRTVRVVAPTFTSITLESNATTLNIGEKATLTLLGTYPDNSTEVLTKNIEYIITPSQSVELNVSTLTALKDGIVTLQAKVGTLLSNTLTLDIAWVVDGYVLPPEPDKALNDSTLLGIDSNNNGVRDDVERWIYKKYDMYIPCYNENYDHLLPNGTTMLANRKICEDEAIPYHPIVRAIAMQGARAAQIIIQEPEKARETTKLMDNAQDCGSYFGVKAYSKSEAVHMGEDFFGKAFDAIQFNTVMRARAYGKYNFALSGGVFRSNPDKRSGCNFDVDNMLGKK